MTIFQHLHHYLIIPYNKRLPHTPLFPIALWLPVPPFIPPYQGGTISVSGEQQLLAHILLFGGFNFPNITLYLPLPQIRVKQVQMSLFPRQSPLGAGWYETQTSLWNEKGRDKQVPWPLTYCNCLPLLSDFSFYSQFGLLLTKPSCSSIVCTFWEPLGIEIDWGLGSTVQLKDWDFLGTRLCEVKSWWFSV